MQKEINKHLKRISSEKLKNNHKECIELYNLVGGLYSEIESYDEAVHYHEKALEISKMIGDRLNTAVAFRFIGEAKASLGQFYQAVESCKKYLELAQKINEKVEIQRAYTTLGRVYLMHAEDMKASENYDDNSVKEIAQQAEKRFQTALNLAESVREQVGEKEFAQMNSGLLINIGLLKDICGQHGESVLRFNRAIEICKKAKLKEDLFRCLNILTGIYRQKDNIKMAARTSEEALVTAKQIGKKLLICDAYIEKGFVKLSQRDFKTAKRMFSQAYLEKSPSESDHIKAIRLTKLTHLISVNYDKLSQDDISSETRMKLCDKLGDLFVSINSYKFAAEFYRRAFRDAKICLKSKAELARILYSMAETYADDKQYENAMVCYEKELVYRNGNDREQCQTLIKIAHMREYLNQTGEKICEAYEKALVTAGKDPRLMYNVLKDYVTYMKKKSFNVSRCKELDNDLLNLKSYPEVVEEIDKEGDEELNELEDEIADIDDIITDDDDDNEVLTIGRRKSKGAKKFKANEVGDTPLHEACIKGDLKRVKSLISQGHEINPRDNAGWIPLHEACNHGHFDIVEHLIENGADVSNRGLKGMSPLHDAATNGHFEIMRLLIKNGANVVALTDTGETILNCLRDYKRRNYSKMSNRDQSEYKQMEAELLNMMDKCGFNLVEEGIKNLGHRKVGSSVIGGNENREITSSKPKKRINFADSNQMASSVRDYKDVIGTLKRKRIIEEPEEAPKKANLPATYNTDISTSVATKEWLLDDDSLNLDSYPQVVEERENESYKGLNELEDEVAEVIEIATDDDDDNEVITIGRRKPKGTTTFGADEFDDSPIHEASSDGDSDGKKSSLISQGHDTSPRDNAGTSKRKRPVEHYDNKSFNLFAQPLVVTIEDRKLLVPIKDEFSTIKWLKESIVERYSTLADAKPIISLAPSSDPDCYFFDGDMCQDVIREAVIAKISGWQLDSIEGSYLINCAQINLSPLDYIKVELRRLYGNKLDLSYTRFPHSHIKPILSALTHRDFTQANLTGSTILLSETMHNSNGRIDMLNTIMSWKRLSSLSLRCVGLDRSHFEILCSRMKLADLKTLDLSFNCIVYKCKEEFKKQVENLRKNCGNLKRLDMRKNQLQFVSTICADSSSLTNELNPAKQVSLTAMMQLSSDNRQLQDLEIVGAEQNEYSVYSA